MVIQPAPPIEDLRAIAAAYIAAYPQASAHLAAFARAEPVDPGPLHDAVTMALLGCLSLSAPEGMRARWERELDWLQRWTRHEAERAKYRNRVASAAHLLGEYREPLDELLAIATDAWERGGGLQDRRARTGATLRKGRHRA